MASRLHHAKGPIMILDHHIDWDISTGLTPYPDALERMESLQASIRDDNAREPATERMSAATSMRLKAG